MEATDVHGRVTFKWNPDGAQWVEGTRLLVNDGGELHTFPLDRNGLEKGSLDYDRKSLRVTGTLHAGDNRVIASYYEPVPVVTPPPEKTKPVTNPKAQRARRANKR